MNSVTVRAHCARSGRLAGGVDDEDLVTDHEADLHDCEQQHHQERKGECQFDNGLATFP